MVLQMLTFADLGLSSLLTPLVGGAVCMVLVKIAVVACERATLLRDRELTARAERDAQQKQA